MNYTEAIDWLENISISFDSNYENYNLKLESVKLFLNYLGKPQNDLNFIHVGGTNGKGSTCHIISSILQEHGFTVGVFSSPHIYDFRERIKINSDYIDKKFIVDFVNDNYKYISKSGLSFFEISFAISLCYFRLKKPKYSIIEVGLGGRLDATNIIKPLISIITNIGFDHKKFLGNNLLDIAKEKAGIIKNGVPVIIGESNTLLNNIFESTAFRNNSKIYYANKTNKIYETDLNGLYQNKNINTAITAINNIFSFKINEVKILNGIKNVKKNTNLIGRWQTIKNNPKVIFDIAHNINSLELIFKELENIKSDIKIVFGTLDKIDQLKCLEIFPKTIKYYLCSPKTKRAMHLSKLSRKADKLKINYKSFKSVRNAYKNAIIDSSNDDVIVVTGSTYLFSEIKP
ncbi:MAG: bifunctional folylpolyglutamate synthase/dihydrofolate synthase [Flavobacteriaceae bacterium TMED238]|nr:tetrahydrofolate synthase [Flavobacteriales bacterium]RPG61095.1 MAG: bifunctional folylpolyglutamate synthase/dihydrofolate synthase [Flavobacteriaceae bacterium TMED238]